MQDKPDNALDNFEKISVAVKKCSLDPTTAKVTETVNSHLNIQLANSFSCTSQHILTSLTTSEVHLASVLTLV
jgi:hypothetical protein